MYIALNCIALDEKPKKKLGRGLAILGPQKDKA